MKKLEIMVAAGIVLATSLLNVTAVFSAAKPIELKLSHFVPPTHFIHTQILEPWAKEVEKRTNGSLKIQIFPGQALGKAPEHYDLAVNGIADIAWVCPNYTPGRFPLTGIYELPFGIPSGETGSLILHDLYNKYLKTEFKDVKVLWTQASSPVQIFTAEKPIRKFEDLQGLKIGAVGGQASMIKTLGGTPIALPAPENYVALQKKIIDGKVFDIDAVVAFKLTDIIKYATIGNFLQIPFVLVMNSQTWASLPQDTQKTLDQLGLEWSTKVVGKVWDEACDRAAVTAKKAGVTFIELQPAELARWKEQFKPLHDEWISKTDAKGLPGMQVHNYMLELIRKYGK